MVKYLMTQMMKRIPIWSVIAICVVITVGVVSCSIVPTSSTVSQENVKMAEQDVIWMLEFLNRCDGMSKGEVSEACLLNLRYSLEMYKIFSGNDAKHLTDLIEPVVKRKGLKLYPDPKPEVKPVIEPEQPK